MFVIDRSEDELRESLHDAVERMSLANIIILLMLVQVVKVVSYLRPGERELETQSKPQLTDGLSCPGLDSVLMSPEIGRLNESIDWASLRPLAPDLHGEWVAEEAVEEETHPPLEWAHVPFSHPTIDAMYPRGWAFQPWPGPTVSITINSAQVSQERWDEIVASLRSGKRRIVLEGDLFPEGSIEMNVGSYTIGGGAFGPAAITIEGEQVQEEHLDGWSHFHSSWGLCTPSRDNMITGGARQGVGAYRLDGDGQARPL